MQRTSFKHMECPAARALECVGEWWSILILRDAFHGLTRFDEFQDSLGIASNILTRRLKHLTQNGLLQRRIYNARPPRYEYVLTAKGRDFFPVLIAMFTWGNKYLTPEGISEYLADRHTGRLLEPILVDSGSLAEITPENVVLQPGPTASAKMRLRARLIWDKAGQTTSSKEEA
jgi:DNA-binding HxlR family transcriptional regulator